MKDPYIFMSMLIPGLNSPGINIDVYLQPLVDELNDLWVGVEAYDSLKNDHRRDDPWFQELGTTCIHITWNDPNLISLEGLGLEVVQNVEKAEFVLVHGTQALGLPSGDSNSMKIEDLQKILEQCVAKKIPMVVAKGTLGAIYKKLGGEVKWMGKPNKNKLRSEEAAGSGTPVEICFKVLKRVPGHLRGRSAPKKYILAVENLRAIVELEKNKSAALEEKLKEVAVEQDDMKKCMGLMMQEIECLKKLVPEDSVKMDENTKNNRTSG